MSTERVTKQILESAKKNIGIGEAMTLGFGAYSFTNAYNQSRQEGQGRTTAVAKGASDAVLSQIIPIQGHMVMGALKHAPKLAVTGYETISKQARSMSMGINQPFATSTFVDNQQIYTMRQAGMSLAEKNKYNMQQALMGNEAQHFHR